MKTMKSLVLVAASLAALTPALVAEEGGSGHYMPGAFASMFDYPPEKPGEATVLQFNYYQGDMGAGRSLPIGGEIRGEVDAKAFAAVLIFIDTLETSVAGGAFSLGVAVPFVHVDVSANVTAGSSTMRRSDDTDAFGDIAILPAMIAWRQGLNQHSVLLSVYAPTGKYDATALANAGKNYWTFEPTYAFNRVNPENGRVITAFAAVDLSTKNDDTDYQSGAVLHLDVTAAQLLPRPDGATLSLGLNAFLYEQITGDSGSGAVLGDFKGHTYGIGPVLGWTKTTKDSTTFAEIKWLPELDVDKRTKGNIFWLKAGASW